VVGGDFVSPAHLYYEPVSARSTVLYDYLAGDAIFDRIREKIPYSLGRQVRCSAARRCAVEYSKKHVIDILRRSGFKEVADEAAKELPDPVDFNFVQEWAWKRGITRDVFISAMGGSP
jgi:hypothetical protein